MLKQILRSVSRQRYRLLLSGWPRIAKKFIAAREGSSTSSTPVECLPSLSEIAEVKLTHFAASD